MPSSVIYSMEYDRELRTLKNTYVSVYTYLYKAIPENVYKELKASRVKGRYLRFFIKSKYPFEKVEGP